MHFPVEKSYWIRSKIVYSVCIRQSSVFLSSWLYTNHPFDVCTMKLKHCCHAFLGRKPLLMQDCVLTDHGASSTQFKIEFFGHLAYAFRLQTVYCFIAAQRPIKDCCWHSISHICVDNETLRTIAPHICRIRVHYKQVNCSILKPQWN